MALKRVNKLLAWRESVRADSVLAAAITARTAGMVMEEVAEDMKRERGLRHARSMRLCLITGEVQASSIPNCSRRSASETDG